MKIWLTAEFDAWFVRLQELSSAKLNPEDWTARWYDGYTPTDALANGASPPPETREEWISRDDHIAAMEAIRAEYMQRLLGSEPTQGEIETYGVAMTTNPTAPIAAANTDRELWREREDDYYADSIHVTEHGGIGINVKGTVIVMPLKEWHRRARCYGRAVHEPTQGEIEALIEQLAVHTVGSCECDVKTPNQLFHQEGCLYRVLTDAMATIAALTSRPAPSAEVACTILALPHNPAATSEGVDNAKK